MNGNTQGASGFVLVLRPPRARVLFHWLGFLSQSLRRVERSFREIGVRMMSQLHIQLWNPKFRALQRNQTLPGSNCLPRSLSLIGLEICKSNIKKKFLLTSFCWFRCMSRKSQDLSGFKLCCFLERLEQMLLKTFRFRLDPDPDPVDTALSTGVANLCVFLWGRLHLCTRSV